jgi:glycosyltransferase involved in cell wall biosynthesis
MRHISVIIPAYNAADYLGEAIESALAQTVAPYEIIVVDDGSTDDTARVAKKYSDAANAALRYLFQTNAGIGAARNRGLAVARGNFFALLDADDVWLPCKLEQQLDAFERAPSADMVFGQVQEFITPELPRELHAQLRCEAEPRAGVIPSALLVSRDAFFRVGMFETRWRVGEFADWMLRAREADLHQVMLTELVVRRRIHARNKGIRQRVEINDYARMFKAALERRRAAGRENA